MEPVGILTHLPGYEIQRVLTFVAGGSPGSIGVMRPYLVLVMVASHSRYTAACATDTNYR